MHLSGTAHSVEAWWHVANFSCKALWKICPKLFHLFTTPPMMNASAPTVARFIQGVIGHPGINFVDKAS